MDFTRDEFRRVLVALETDAEFQDQWYRTATRLGYTVEQVGTNESWPGWPADAWILQLADPDETSDRTTRVTTVRRVVLEVRTVIDRLLGRSNR